MPEKQKTLVEIRQEQLDQANQEFERRYGRKRLKYLMGISKNFSKIAKGLEEKILYTTRTGGKPFIQIDIGENDLPFITLRQKIPSGIKMRHVETGELQELEGFKELLDVCDILNRKYKANIKCTVEKRERYSFGENLQYHGYEPIGTSEKLNTRKIGEYTTVYMLYGQECYLSIGTRNVLEIRF